MPTVTLTQSLESLPISELVNLYNEHADAPVKSFRDKPTALKRVRSLGIDIKEPDSKLEETTSSPGFRRMSKNLGEGQEALRAQVLADQEAATRAVERSDKFTWSEDDLKKAPTETAEAFSTRQRKVRKAKAPKEFGDGRGKHRLFDNEAVIGIVNADLNGKRGEWLERFAEHMRDGQTVGAYLAQPGTKRRDVRVAWRKYGMITLNGERYKK